MATVAGEIWNLVFKYNTTKLVKTCELLSLPVPGIDSWACGPLYPPKYSAGRDTIPSLMIYSRLLLI